MIKNKYNYDIFQRNFDHTDNIFITTRIISSYLSSHKLPREIIGSLICSVYNSVTSLEHKPLQLVNRGGLPFNLSSMKTPLSAAFAILPESSPKELKGHYDPWHKVFSLQIKAARALLNLSQKDLADLAGLSLTFISAAERNIHWTRRSPYIANIIRSLELEGVNFVSATNRHGSGVRFAQLHVRGGKTQTPSNTEPETQSAIEGKLVRAGRELLEWSQYDLAKSSGHTVTDIVSYERLGVATLGIEHATRTALMKKGMVFLSSTDNYRYGICLPCGF